MNRRARHITKRSAPSFSQIVCGAPQVLEAFAHHAPARAWWAIVLRLHGKPVESGLQPEERARRVGQGFGFYAHLYRALAVVFGVLAPILAALGTIDASLGLGLYAPGACLLAALYLWLVSGLGYVGARSYARGEEQGRISLLAFMVAIVAFLSSFVAAISAAAHHASWLNDAPNLLAAGLLLAFGVGSYLIEILYLAAEPLTPA